MPYNTRRKSVSLASLGVVKVRTTTTTEPVKPGSNDQPPTKRVKRVHHEPAPAVRPTLDTPPPSPHARNPPINYDNIGDEIVTSVVKVLERTGNRPHTVRELTQLCSNGVNIIENSANPHAIISSRLNAYLKRGNFTKNSPCLLERELVTSHPKRTYFYLSTCKAQPIPEYVEIPAVPQRAIASPAPSDEEEEVERRRRVPSPSPDLDIYNEEYESDAMSDENSSVSMISRDRTSSPSLRNSPPLEGDEQEFSDAAISFSIRHGSASRDWKAGIPTPPIIIEETSVDNDHHTAGIFGNYSLHTNIIIQSSPLVRPVSPSSTPKVTGLAVKPFSSAFTFNTPEKSPNWGTEFVGPEAINIEELDDLFDI